MPSTSPRSIAEHFETLEDPRRLPSTQHSLQDILVLSICAVICGADSFTAIEEFGHTKIEFLRRYLKLPHRIPSHDTIGRVFAMLDTEQFATCFADWMASVFTATDGEVVSLDGKRLRRSYDQHSNQAVIEMVGAWASENSLVLGSLQTNPDSNEVEALPRLIELLDLHGCIVTIDAAGCQRSNTKALIEKGADYVLALKENQGGLFDEVEALFERVDLSRRPSAGVVSRGVGFAEHTDGGHGRIEVRRCWVLPVEEAGLVDTAGWSGLRTVTMIERERTTPTKTSQERHYYISSLEADAEQMLAVVRQHWHVENRLHWVLDVAFGEDQSRVRTGQAAANLGLVRRVAVSALQRESSIKRGVGTKRLKAAWDEKYLLKVLQGL
jgi:predicted transposase YbfD/YdcC